MFRQLGLLSLDETPLDEDRFNSIDADGDGFITADELSVDMEENMAEGMPMPQAGMEEMAIETSGAASGLQQRAHPGLRPPVVVATRNTTPTT